MEFKKFDPATATDMNTILVIGQRSVGKTVLVQELLPHLQCCETLVINPNESVKMEYTHILARQNIQDNYDKRFIKDFIKSKQGDNPSICIVFENCYETSCIKMLFSCKMKTCIIMQYPSNLAADFDYTFIFKNTNLYCRKLIYNTITDIFPTFEMFCDAFDQITAEPFACMVINKTARTVLWYKAAEPWRMMVEHKKKQIEVFQKELMAKAWHPSRVLSCLCADEVKDIFGCHL
jgi:hypothetical protein